MVLNLIFVGCPCFYEFYNNLVYRLQYVFSGFRYSSLVLVNYIVFCIILFHANILFTLYSFARFNLLVFPVYFWLVLFHCCCIADGFEFQINCSGKSLNPSRSCRWLPRPVTNTLSISAKNLNTYYNPIDSVDKIPFTCYHSTETWVYGLRTNFFLHTVSSHWRLTLLQQSINSHNSFKYQS